MCPRSDPGTGSPPRGRGKVFPRARRAAGRGIIPALAGKSPAPLIQSLDSRDHPRVGGEKGLRPQAGSMHRGSPPRGRGKVGNLSRVLCQLGITPAWAGKSVLPTRRCQIPKDHPRVGGEKGSGASRIRLNSGSPPRGRGKANWHCVRRPALRITPAQAGKRTRSWRAYGCPWDHPRMGGEKANGSDAPDDDEGSPPHGQGKDDVFRGQILLPGITPAWAGKSSAQPRSGPPGRDHPRVGGEKCRE